MKQFKTRKSKPVRSKRAVSLLELSAVLLVLVPIVIALVDTALVFVAQSINESVCKELARTLSLYSFEPNTLKGESVLSRNSQPFAYAEKTLASQYSIQSQAFAHVSIERISISNLNGGISLLSASPEDKLLNVATAIDLKLPFIVSAMMPSEVILRSNYSFPLCTLELKSGYEHQQSSR